MRGAEKVLSSASEQRSQTPTGWAEFDVGVPAVVLKLHRINHAGLGIVRSLGRVGVPVYSSHNERFNPIMASRYLAGSFIWRPNRLDDRQMLSGMLGIARNLGRRSVLIPTDDLSALFIARHAETLAPHFLFPRQAPDVIRSVMNKGTLYERCLELGIPAPRGTLAASPNDLRRYAGSGPFPVVVKVCDPLAIVSDQTLPSTSIAWTPGDLSRISELAEAHPVGTLLLQEYIPSQFAEDWFLHAYSDERSECRVAFTGRKLRSWPPHAGMTTLGVPRVNETLLRLSEKLIASVGYRGLLDQCWRLDLRDGQYKLLDFNPRLGAQFTVSVNTAGIDVVRAAHLDLTGRAVPSSPQVEGGTLWIEDFDVLSLLQSRGAGELTFRSWLSSLRGVETFGYWAADDPLPFTAMCARRLGRALERPVRRTPKAIRGGRLPHYVAGRGPCLREAPEVPRAWCGGA